MFKLSFESKYFTDTSNFNFILAKIYFTKVRLKQRTLKQRQGKFFVQKKIIRLEHQKLRFYKLAIKLECATP